MTLGRGAEVLEFVPLADTIIMTVTLGHTNINAARRAIEMIRALSTGNILLVIIGGDTNDTNYYYYYSTNKPDEPKGRLSRLTSRKSKRPAEAVSARAGQPVVYPTDVDLLAPLQTTDDDAISEFLDEASRREDDGDRWPDRPPEFNGDDPSS